MTDYATELLRRQLNELNRNPPEGVSVGLVDDSNIYQWELLIVGPPDTLYEEGLFKATLEFPKDFPNSPPTMTFTSAIGGMRATPLPPSRHASASYRSSRRQRRWQRRKRRQGDVENGYTSGVLWSHAAAFCCRGMLQHAAAAAGRSAYDFRTGGDGGY
eukprot:TRINITY_DN1936_c1_g1_i2.p1 TRINITY_DN1936_c1_g1~~TRINITY_DN1936_c1_g1_i2.p1  ORF type:complete len:159 (-),score=43.33 TRINITY_DN1936_c1_g1_i2:96-572(-)